MSKNHTEREEISQERTSLDVHRRSLLKGVAALGVGGGAIGTAAAQQQNGGSSDDDGDESSGVPISIQLYTLRNLPDSVPQLIQRVGSVDNNGGPGYDAVEFAGLGGASTEEVNSVLDQTGLSAPSAHIGLESLEGDSFESTAQTYADLGVDMFVTPGLPSIDSVQKAESVAQRMNDVAANLEEYDARFGFHNHDAVFEEIDGRTILEVLDENLNDNVIFEIDVGWVHTAGHDPVEVIRKYSTRTELIHMKDMQDGGFYELGEGALDLETIAEVAREEANVEYLVYEHDRPENPAGSVGTGAGVLSFLDGRPGLECLEFEDVGGPDYNGNLSGEVEAEPISAPFGWDAGGTEASGTVTIDGIEFVSQSGAVEAYGDGSASSNGAVVETGVSSDPIEGTEHDLLYQSEQYGGNLSYDVSIENGTYDVTLQFAEFYFGGDFNGSPTGGGEGSRVFDVSVQGEQVFSKLDIYARVGHDAAFTKTVEDVEVTDGNLSITTKTYAENSKFSGFVIRPAEDNEDLDPIVGDKSPTDPDDDGKYEDINGDGEENYDDVVDFFHNYDDSVVQENPDAFDFNENGQLDFDDIVELFRSQ
ncbi:malectin domain-containing carbohydrate-binding protein [Haladaptatus sp. CMAA 1911]|uniref:malectin domain-containing carbohydrate-binding protein n=1 Tax=unclassified Haladaptatus TaxID=2622732 RepID=UPI0037546BDD